MTTKIMLGIINDEYWCPKLNEFKQIAVTYKKILGTDIFAELVKLKSEKLFFSEPNLPSKEYML